MKAFVNGAASLSHRSIQRCCSLFSTKNGPSGETVPIETDRLILRPWKETDAEKLYEYAKNPLVGPMAGWPAHTSVECSLQIIQNGLSAKGSYAITLKGEDFAIGGIRLMTGADSNLHIGCREAEIGYWLGVPHWGQGIMPEAAREVMRYAFDKLDISAIWCGYFVENEKSKRVTEKCGFLFHHTEYEKEYPYINAVKTQQITRITKKEWLASLNP